MSKKKSPRAHLEAWRAVMIIHAELVPRMDEDLRARTPLDLQAYDTLLHVFETGREGVRMSDLATKVAITRAGLTSLVDRLEARGLLSRLPDPDDRRATRIVLTGDGETQFRDAAAVHVESIDEYFSKHMTEAEAASVARILGQALNEV